MIEREYLEVRALSNLQNAKNSLLSMKANLPGHIDKEVFDDIQVKLKLWERELYEKCIKSISDQEY